MTYRVRNIGIAVALAVLAAVMISYYVTNYKRTVQKGASDVTVLVATKDIPAGTAGADVSKQHLLRSITVARSAVVPGAISNGSELTNLVATQTTYAGEQVSARRFASQSAGGVRASITGPQRVLQIPGDSNQLLAGTLKDGDHVDVVGSWAWPDTSSSLHVGRVVVRNALVLRAPSSLGLDATQHITTGPQGQLSLQLQLSDQQAQKVWWLVENGTWSLALRPTLHGSDASHGTETPSTMLGHAPDPGLGANQITSTTAGGPH
jgi:pilus assembly protein CpaB